MVLAVAFLAAVLLGFGGLGGTRGRIVLLLVALVLLLVMRHNLGNWVDDPICIFERDCG
jgi:hypothetical protein